MKVFISWSGNKSHKVALVFRDWLPCVIQTLEPYVSSEDIDKGVRWSTDIAKELENSAFGILCVTKENMNAPWLAFEAGALSKTMDKTFVSPFLFDIKRSEVNGPLLQFQSTIFHKEDIGKLLKTINKACGENSLSESRLAKAFNNWYSNLESELNKLKDVHDDQELKYDSNKNHLSEVLEEILELSRNNQKLLRNQELKANENNIDELKEQLNLRYIQNIPNKDEVKIALPTMNGFEFMPVKEIIYCEADNTYTKIHSIDQKLLLVSRTLKACEDMLSGFNFYRIHSSFLINMRHVKEYIRAQGQVKMINNVMIDVRRRKKDEFLSLLKSTH